MHSSIFFRGSVYYAGDALLSTVSTAALYGKGIFSTIPIRESEISFWEKHWRRLTVNAAKVGLDISGFSEEVAQYSLHEIIAKNNVNNGRARITFFDESAGGIWSFETERKTSLLITTADSRGITDNFRLTVSPHRINTTSPLAGIKSCNYLEYLMAFEEAKTRGFDEVIRLNERGEIASACMANVFWSKKGKLYTPSLKTGCMPGTTREYVLENLECFEVEAAFEELLSAEDIFLTSAGIGVVQIAEFEGIAMKRRPHRILEVVPKWVSEKTKN